MVNTTANQLGFFYGKETIETNIFVSFASIINLVVFA